MELKRVLTVLCVVAATLGFSRLSVAQERPNGPDFMLLRANADAAYRAQHWQDAISLYADIEKGDPADGVAWFRLGRAKSRLGNFTDSIADFREAIRLGFVDEPRGDYFV